MPKMTNEGEDLRDVGDRVTQGWAPSPIARGFDTPPRNTLASIAEATAMEGPMCPAICDVGPCRNLHVMEVVMNTAQPIDGSGGSVYFETVRTCYPHDGIEFVDLPRGVAKCNRWNPVRLSRRVGRGGSDADEIRDDMRALHDSAVDAWIAAQRKTQKEAEDSAVQTASSYIADDDQPKTEGDAP